MANPPAENYAKIVITADNGEEDVVLENVKVQFRAAGVQIIFDNGNGILVSPTAYKTMSLIAYEIKEHVPINIGLTEEDDEDTTSWFNLD